MKERTADSSIVNYENQTEESYIPKLLPVLPFKTKLSVMICNSLSYITYYIAHEQTVQYAYAAIMTIGVYDPELWVSEKSILI